MTEREPEPGATGDDPRAAFAAALTRLRRQVAGLSDETIARRASASPLLAGRRGGVNARRLGEWLNGKSVPREFEAVGAVVSVIETAAGRSAMASLPQWRRLWRAAAEHRGTTSARVTTPTGTAGRVVVGRAPRDAAALRERIALATTIDEALRDTGTRQVLLTGPGGVGKSQLAAAAFHRARARAEVLVWTPASARQPVVSTYARAWRALSRVDSGSDRAPGDHGGDDDTQADLFLTWLRTTGSPWLIVLDDVDDPGELAGLWPSGEAGRCVITSRRREAALIRPGVTVVPVGTFDPEEAAGYLRARLSTPSDAGVGLSEPLTDAELSGLAAALGCFPLALGQAAAFLIDTGMSVRAYRRMFDDQQETIAELFPASSPADEHDGTVASAIQVAVRRAAQLAPPETAQAMLQLVSVLAPDGIPQSVLLSRPAREWLGVSGERDALLALRALHRLNLVTHDTTRDPAAVDVHALVQRTARESVPSARWPTLLGAAASALDETWSGADGDSEVAEALFRNTAALRVAAGGLIPVPDGLHPVLRRPAAHLIAAGRVAAGRELCLELLATATQRYGPGHRDVLFLRAQAAGALGEFGDVDAAHEELTRVCEAAQATLGPRDPDTLWIRIQAARFLMERGAADVAGRDLTSLAAEAEAVLGEDHPTTVAAGDYAALCRGLAGDHDGAREAYTAIVARLRAHRGPHHPDTLAALSDLGRWIGEAGDPAGAVRTYEEAAAGLAATLGPLHGETLIARHNLAYWRAIAGQLDRAVPEFAAAARDAAQALGEEHPTTLTYRLNMAFWRGRAGEPQAALADLTDLQHVVDRVFSPRHPRALRCRVQRAQLRYATGDRRGALEDLRTALAETVEVQGVDHPHTRDAAAVLAAWEATGK